MSDTMFVPYTSWAREVRVTSPSRIAIEEIALTRYFGIPASPAIPSALRAQLVELWTALLVRDYRARRPQTRIRVH